MKVRGELAELVKEFKPGYRVGPPRGSGNLPIIDPAGNAMRLASGQPVTLPVHVEGGKHAIRRVRRNLIEAGVIEKTPAEALIDDIRERAPLTLPEAVQETEDAHNAALEEWGRDLGIELNGNRALLPEIVLNVDWDEFIQLERAAGFIVDKGARTVEQFQPFLRLVERARALMERRIAVRTAKVGEYVGH